MAGLSVRLRRDRGRVRRGGGREAGAVAVEAALVTPLFVLLVFAIIEFGFLFKDYLAMTSSVRAGVRMASAEPRLGSFAQDSADKVAAAGRALNMADVQELWVYKADPLTGRPAGFGSFSGCTTCVKFRWDAGSKTFVTTTDNWPASTQNACSANGPGGPPDSIGVFLKVRHDAFTGLVFDSLDLAESSALNLEPIPARSGCR